MKPIFQHAGAGPSAPGYSSSVHDSTGPVSRDWPQDQACCCPAQPVVRVIMPPTPKRPHSVDLLLCGHHYRISRQALAAAGARIEAVPGKEDAAEAALLGEVRRDHAKFM
jgi:hypothetical protein